jgi:GWxTD domain-containing protein
MFLLGQCFSEAIGGPADLGTKENRRTSSQKVLCLSKYLPGRTSCMPIHGMLESSQKPPFLDSVMKKTFPFLLSLILLQSLAVSQEFRYRGTFTFNADFARFQYDSTASDVEVYYGLYPRLLSYRQVDSVHKGMVVIRTAIKNKATDSTVLDQRLLVPVTITDTTFRTVTATLVTQTSYAIPFGDYILTVAAYDSLQPANRDSVSYSLELHRFPSTASSSDLELCSDVTQASHESKLFEKNSLYAIPNPSLVFGVTSHPVSFYYMELYNVAPDTTYTIKTRLYDGSNKIVRELTKSQKYTSKNVVDVGMMNVSSFPSGRYRMGVSVYNGTGTEVCTSAKTLFLSNPHIKQPVANSVTLNANEFAGMTSDELAAEFREGQYLATPEEMKRFKQMTTQEAKRDFLAKFWLDVEKGQDGRRSIDRTVYLHRVTIANQRYRGMGKEGWQTDRGRVYLLYGEPDEVERFPNSEDSKPYEVWHYYQIESGVEFDFIDRNGFGNYTLVNSTKRGEIQDSGWQQYLR